MRNMMSAYWYAKATIGAISRTEGIHRKDVCQTQRDTALANTPDELQTEEESEFMQENSCEEAKL